MIPPSLFGIFPPSLVIHFIPKLTDSAVLVARVATYCRWDGLQPRHQISTRLIPEQVQRVDTRPQRASAVVMAVLVAIGICILKAHNVIYYWWAPIANAYSLLVCTYVFLRVARSMFYKEPKDVGYLPTISLIVSAKNEENHIRETVRHTFESRYPSDLMEVIVVDDGSTDKTPQVLAELAKEYPRLRVLNHTENKGKRYAMATGAMEAKHEILVFVDSDSLVDEEGVYRIVQPFHDKAIGAVAGEISVVVEPDNFFSKMEVVRYQISQRVIKASESLFNAVTCCSGPCGLSTCVCPAHPTGLAEPNLRRAAGDFRR